MTEITIETTIHADPDHVWETWTKPEHITRWAFASDDWTAPHAENDVRTGGRFKTVMAAADGSQQFDFSGVYTRVADREAIEYDMDDGRHVRTRFSEVPGGVHVSQTFEAEEENPVEMQREGWQSILDNFKKYTESTV
jgi:uncharacterized protein YndB with AHSA1/START domain